MICGTSTGGLIAIMLGRLEMSVDQCIKAYIEMMDSIFDPKDKKKLPFKMRDGKVQPRYKTAHMEQAIKQVISNAGYTSDDPFRGEKKFACKTVVIALTKESSTPIRFTDYAKPGEHSNFYNEVKIWEVARATSAATSFFAPMRITHAGEPRCFLDAGIGSNNPINELYLEAMSEFKKSEDYFDKQIRVLVSIGTGRPALHGFGDKVTEVAKSIASIATETQATANTFHLMHRGLANRNGYFRFNPPDLSEVALDEANKKDIIASRTEAYGTDAETLEMVERWTNATGTEQSRLSSPAPSRLLKVPATKLFYSLHGGSKYIKEGAPSYWRYLSLDSYYVYENIYNNCNPQGGKVTFKSFVKQFGPGSMPSPEKVVETWMRLLHDNSDVRHSIHRKPFVMATLYMLHIESCLNIPKIDVDKNRREILKRFSKWVECKCEGDCGRQWNFVNEIGLSRGSNGRGKCDLLDLFDNKSSWKLVFKSDKVRKLQDTRKMWEVAV
ncbi:phospholipase [Amniculicola lignicola CBS 123094]|uniref:Phospholipase n=1 Tax=Amniculicola lignicola CBS 123094 TaxID=1392246 RepID=A0A6A5W3B2_9PLEO|nr:phospholipase [Amniculicola lignicola CBS 123094]